MQASNKPIIWSIAIATIVMLVFGGFGYANLNSQNDILKEKIDSMEFPTALEIGNAVILPEIPVTESDKIDEMYDEIFEDDQLETLIEELALEEIGNKDFKKVLVDKLNAKGENVESYKDIETIYSVNVEKISDVASKESTVTIEFKVKYFNDGDDEEEDLQKAKLSVDVTITDLDEDDDYEDAEVDDLSKSDFTLIKFYD